MVEMARMGSTESIVARCGGYGFRDDMHVEENVLIFKAPPPLLPKVLQPTYILKKKTFHQIILIPSET